jgi:hypothetical protein
MAATSTSTTMISRDTSTRTRGQDPSGWANAGAAGVPREWRTQERRYRRDIGRQYVEAAKRPSSHIMVVVVSPITLPAPPALAAATTAGEEADVHVARGIWSSPPWRRSSRLRCCREIPRSRTPARAAPAALPVIRQEARQQVRQLALLEVPGQQRESHQQREQVG